jgi:hypothetical protein
MKQFLGRTGHMNELFLQWAQEHTQELLDKGIVTEIRDNTRDITEKPLPNPAQVVYYSSPTHLGIVTVWQEGFMDMETLKIEHQKKEYNRHFDKKTGKFVYVQQSEYYRHFDDITRLNFDELLEEFFQNMLSILLKHNSIQEKNLFR